MLLNHFQIKARDGITLSGKIWRPVGGLKAVVVLVHGLGEHIGRYDHVAEALNHSGIALMGTDLRGHGNSEGKRGHAPTFGSLLDDVFQTLEKARAEFPSTPLFLYGHSLGGLVALKFVLERKPELSGIIVSAPLLELAFQPPVWQQALLNLLNAMKLHPSIPSNLDDTKLSRDLNVIRAYRNDPLTHDRITPPLATGMIDAGQWCLDHAEKLSIPALIIHGEADQITSPEATQAFAANVSSDCTLEILPGLFHEPHNEPEKASVLNLITDWIRQTA